MHGASWPDLCQPALHNVLQQSSERYIAPKGISQECVKNHRCVHFYFVSVPASSGAASKDQLYNNTKKNKKNKSHLALCLQPDAA